MMDAILKSRRSKTSDLEVQKSGTTKKDDIYSRRKYKIVEYHKLIEVCYLIMVLNSVARKTVDDCGS